MSGVYDTGFLTQERMDGWPEDDDMSEVAAIAAAIAAFERDNQLTRPDARARSNPWRWSLR